MIASLHGESSGQANLSSLQRRTRFETRGDRHEAQAHLAENIPRSFGVAASEQRERVQAERRERREAAKHADNHECGPSREAEASR